MMNETDRIMILVMHAGWVGYQIGVGQPYNVEPTESQMGSLLDAIEHRRETKNLTPEGEHENWMKFKLANGWRYGPTKDEIAKTHPDLLPWNELPEVERRKDIQSIEAWKIAKEVEQLISIYFY